MSMRIARIDATIVELPCRFPIESAVRSSRRVVNLLVDVRTEDDLGGSAYVAGFTRGKARALRAMVEELAPMVIGLEVTETARAWERMRRACRLLGASGAGTFALSAIDIALWDAKARSFASPLHRLLGSAQDEVRAYASDGCWLSADPLQTADEAATFVEEGFASVKVRVGRPHPEVDLSVLDEVRAAVGPDVDLLIDANQGWDLPTARRFGRELESRSIDWFEEPIVAEDLRGLRRLQRELPLRIAAGESSSLPEGIVDLVHRGQVSIVMPDLQRVGGVTGWLRASGVAESTGRQLSSHLFPEVSVHLLAASPGAGPLEYVSWMAPFLVEPLTIEDGVAEVPDRPGLGIEFDWGELGGCIVD